MHSLGQRWINCFRASQRGRAIQNRNIIYSARCLACAMISLFRSIVIFIFGCFFMLENPGWCQNVFANEIFSNEKSCKLGANLSTLASLWIYTQIKLWVFNVNKECTQWPHVQWIAECFVKIPDRLKLDIRGFLQVGRLDNDDIRKKMLNVNRRHPKAIRRWSTIC